MPDGKSPLPAAIRPAVDAIARLRIHGRVQGVWYRGSATAGRRASASRAGCATAATEQSRRSPIGRCQGRNLRRLGPPGPENARVSRVEVFEAELERLTGFEQRPTV